MSAVREVLSLDGEWTLLLPGGDTHTVRVPGAWTTQVAGYGDSHAPVRYRRRFDWLPGEDEHRCQVLRFEAVNHRARVWLNGRWIGEHEGAWLPFEFDVTAALRTGENLLEIEVSYPPRLGTADEPGFLEHPVGKQSWYGTNAGIWQPVRLEDRAVAHLREVRLSPDVATGRIEVRATVTEAGAEVRAVVRDGDRELDSIQLTVGDVGACEGWLQLVDPRRWDPDDPHLYAVEVMVVDDARVLDSQTLATGFRDFHTEDGAFFLNGREIYLRAVLDQDYHPGSELAPDDFEAWEDLLRQTKALGFTMLRVHIKRPDPRYYEIADRIGLLVWTELPSWMTWSPQTAAAGLDLLRDLIAVDGHHPSIVIWTIINESWGVDLSSATQRAWLRSAYDEIAARARGSLVVDNSACEPNFHLRTDIDDYHVYRGIPESRREWDAKITDFAGRPGWTFSPHGDAERTGAEPLVLSEFGNWGLPHALDQYRDGAEPWWFPLGAGWAFGAAEATGLLDRFHSLGLDEAFGTWDALIEQLQRAQAVANCYQTTSIRMRPQIRGYVLTQLSDVQWEANGLFDANRRAKKLTEQYALVNGEHAIALRPDSYSGFGGDDLAATITVVPGPAGIAAGAVRITIDGAVVASDDRGPAAGPGTVLSSGRGTLDGPAAIRLPDRPGEYELAAELLVDGCLVARDAADIVVLGRDAWTGDPVATADPELAAWLGALGVPARFVPADDALPSGLLAVGRHFTEPLRRLARAGGRVLLLVEDDSALGDAFDYLPAARLGPRSGDGDWVPRTEWLDRTGPFAALPGGPILGIAFEDLLGDLVLNGVPGPLRPAHVHSGVFSGWLRGAAATTATLRWSSGALTVTTLKVRTGADVPAGFALGRALLKAATEAVGGERVVADGSPAVSRS